MATGLIFNLKHDKNKLKAQILWDQARCLVVAAAMTLDTVGMVVDSTMLSAAHAQTADKMKSSEVIPRSTLREVGKLLLSARRQGTGRNPGCLWSFSGCPRRR
jgi:hypothetical protein